MRTMQLPFSLLGVQTDSRVCRYLLYEIGILSVLRHPFIARFFGAWEPPPDPQEEARRAFLVLEFGDGDIWKMLVQSRRRGNPETEDGPFVAVANSRTPLKVRRNSIDNVSWQKHTCLNICVVACR